MAYEGMLYDVPLQVADTLKVPVTVAVFSNKAPLMLLGNDVIGGANAKLQVVAMNA